MTFTNTYIERHVYYRHHQQQEEVVGEGFFFKCAQSFDDININL